LSLGQSTRMLSSRRAIIPLILILLVTSAAFVATSSIFLSVDRTASAMLGESGDIVVVTQGDSRTPLTGALPLSLAGEIGSVSGVETVSPEILAPSTISGEPVMVRGVDPQQFMELQHPQLVAGSTITLNDTSEVMVGETLAKQMRLVPGSEVAVVGGIRATVAQLTVLGIISTGTPLDDEVIAPLWVGDWLRGLDYGIVSIFRVGVSAQDDPSVVALQVQRVLMETPGAEPAPPSASSASLSSMEAYLPNLSTGALTSSAISKLDIQSSLDASSEFLSRSLGLSEDTVWLLSAIVFLSMSVAIVCALQEVVFKSRTDFGILRTLGMSSTKLSLALVSAATLVSLVASLIGTLVGWVLLTALAETGPIRIAFYTVDPLSSFPLSSLATVTVITLTGVVAATIASLRFKRSQTTFEMTIPYLEAETDIVGE
jgi:ABC-type lipoprotein release transport system permease subunit